MRGDRFLPNPAGVTQGTGHRVVVDQSLGKGALAMRTAILYGEYRVAASAKQRDVSQRRLDHARAQSGNFIERPYFYPFGHISNPCENEWMIEFSS